MSIDSQRRLVHVRGRRERTLHQSATVECVDCWPAPPGHQRLSLTIDLGELPSRWEYVGLFLRVRVDDPGVVASELSVKGGVPSAAVGIGERAFGWFIGHSPDSEFLAHPLEMAAVLDVPADADDIGLEIRLDVSMVRRPLLFRRSSRKVRHARVDRPWRVRKPAERDSVRPVSSLRPSMRLPVAPTSVRLCFALDIENYSRFHGFEAVWAQRRLLDVVSRAQANTGVAAHARDIQSSGDGVFVVLPPGVDETFAIPVLVQGLVDALDELNRSLPEHERLRLRLALHRGAMRPSSNEWAGNAVIAVHRLLDAPILRAALRGACHTDLALIVPDMLFRDVIVGCGHGLMPSGFEATMVDLPQKSFSEHAWIYVPAKGVHSGLQGKIHNERDLRS